MRIYLLAAIMLGMLSCNDGDKKADPNQAMDDTARMRNPPPPAPMELTAAEILASDVPAEMKISGKFQQGWKWKDELGDNVLVLSVKGPYDDKRKNEYGEEGETTELYALHYAGQPGALKPIAGHTDEERACPFDITANFIPGSTTITDLDKDGIAEIKLQYLVACRSDVSPATMKLVLFENGTKYALEGSSWIRYSPDFKFNVTEKDVNLASLPPLKDETESMLRSFGRYENEKGFETAPPGFIEYARKQWLRHVMEKMGE